MERHILTTLQHDLDATGLADRVRAAEAIGHRDARELAEDCADPDRTHAGTYGLGRRLPASASAAGDADLELRAAAEFLQSMLIETSFVQWPVCGVHAHTLLTPNATLEGGATWWCVSDEPHQVAAIGELADARDVGYRGRARRR